MWERRERKRKKSEGCIVYASLNMDV